MKNFIILFMTFVFVSLGILNVCTAETFEHTPTLSFQENNITNPTTWVCGNPSLYAQNNVTSNTSLSNNLSSAYSMCYFQ